MTSGLSSGGFNYFGQDLMLYEPNRALNGFLTT